MEECVSKAIFKLISGMVSVQVLELVYNPIIGPSTSSNEKQHTLHNLFVSLSNIQSPCSVRVKLSAGIFLKTSLMNRRLLVYGADIHNAGWHIRAYHSLHLLYLHQVSRKC